MVWCLLIAKHSTAKIVTELGGNKTVKRYSPNHNLEYVCCLYPGNPFQLQYAVPLQVMNSFKGFLDKYACSKIILQES